MDIRFYVREGFHLILLCIYPLIELYGYFIYCGMFGLDSIFFKPWRLTVYITVYSIFISFKIIIYLQIQAINDRSTLRIFPSTLENSSIRLFTNINPFIIENQVMEAAENIQTCEFCETYKPPRAHHCSRCNRCFLKYDHHNYFLDLCIGFHNYKLFYQFLFVNFLSGLFYIITIGVNLIVGDNIPRTSLINMCISLGIFGIEMAFITYELIFQTWLIYYNETSIEHKAINKYLAGDYSYIYTFQEGQIKSFSPSKDRRVLNPYFLGWRRNWREVFGTEPLKWFIPVFSSMGNGVSFKTNADSSCI